jgi:5-methylcytosine-specific restriction endonuclease McrA
MADQIISRKEARLQGLKHYFTGCPCPRGHIAKKFVNSKKCLECSRERTVEFRAKNPEKAPEYDRRYRNKIGEERNRRRREIRTQNLEYVRAQERARNPDRTRNRDPEKNRQYARNWRQRYPEKHHQQWQEWKANNPELYKECQRKGWRNRRARKALAVGTFTSDDVKEIIEAQKGRCAYCRKNIRRKYHEDHIVPLARGGSNERSNIQVLCPKCNRKKNKQDPLRFARALGKLL